MWIVALTGEQDVSTATDVDLILIRTVASGNPVVVDLRGATFVDSSILSAIIRAANQANREGLAVVLPTGGEVPRVFDLVNARSMVMTFATLEEAVDSFSPHRRGPKQAESAE
jgi:anti-anti-sigma factor